MDAEKPKRKVDEATLRRLAEGRLKGLETRRKRAELKKQEKQEARKKLNQEYEEKILKKTIEAEREATSSLTQREATHSTANNDVEETEEEIYSNAVQSNDAESDSEPEVQSPIKKPTRKQKVATEKNAPNFKQEYYRLKLERLQKAQEESSFQHHYARLPTYNHAVDIAKSQITNKVNNEIYNRVFKDLFGGGQ